MEPDRNMIAAILLLAKKITATKGKEEKMESIIDEFTEIKLRL